MTQLWARAGSAAIVTPHTCSSAGSQCIDSIIARRNSVRIGPDTRPFFTEVRRLPDIGERELGPLALGVADPSFVEALVDATAIDELAMRSNFDDATFVEHDNQVSSLGGRQPVVAGRGRSQPRPIGGVSNCRRRR